MYGGRKVFGFQPPPPRPGWNMSPQSPNNFNRPYDFRQQQPISFNPHTNSLFPTPPPQHNGTSFANRLMRQPRKILNAFRGPKNSNKKKKAKQSNDSPATTSNKNQNTNLKRACSSEPVGESDTKRQKDLDGEPITNNDIGRYNKLTEQIEKLTQRHSQSEELLSKKLKLRSALLNMIQRRFPGVSLHLVGSSCNGFASDSSDADFCIMITQARDVNQKHEARFYLKTVESLIRPLRSLRGMQFIPAKVPILKFKDMVSGCECDVNINNAVGIRNTHLLRTYSKVDQRVQPMVMALKKWGKARRINDASQGTLSSYSLVLMIIHYLQIACKPPVLESLQQKYPQFFPVDSNVDDLPMFEPANMMPCNDSNNNQSVGQLIEGFFQYYSNFSWDSQIISVRLGTLIQKKHQREFKDKYISIEEPFEQTNTARAVYEVGKFTLIKKEIQRAHQRLKEQLSLDYIQ